MTDEQLAEYGEHMASIVLEMQQIEGFAKYVTPANIDKLLADYSGRVRVDGPAYAAITAIAAKLREAWGLT